MGEILDAQRECWSTSESKGFHKAHEDLPPWAASSWCKLMLCVTELAEAAEELRDASSPADLKMEVTVDGKPVGFESELADTIIRIMDFADSLGLNMEKALQVKMAYNLTRPAMHGRGA